jgi:hypothetical protein
MTITIPVAVMHGFIGFVLGAVVMLIALMFVTNR